MTRAVEVVDAGTTLRVAEDVTVLAAALAAGVPYPHSCQAGRCGACKSRLLEGEVELLPHSRFALSAEERSQGLVLACRSLPRSDLRITWQHEIEAPPPVSYQQATVMAKHAMAPNILRLTLRSGLEPFRFLPGQYYELGFPGAPLRSFSPASQPDSDEIEFHIRVLPGGAASSVLAARLIAGDAVAINGPYGGGYLREAHQGPLLLLAASSGLAPIKSILDRALQVTPTRQIRLYVSVRLRDDGYLWGYLDHLAREHANLYFEAVVTRDRAGRPVGRRLPEVLQSDFADSTLRGWEVHAAGPEPFVDAVRTAATQLAASDIHADAFVAASQGSSWSAEAVAAPLEGALQTTKPALPNSGDRASPAE
jgi:CDP-4-dehydro-6-deoxyglucose reductase/ferredoxin-NAD(P)+ reductase (naphthalene dioxygenase ferredoxin-specific)